MIKKIDTLHKKLSCRPNLLILLFKNANAYPKGMKYNITNGLAILLNNSTVKNNLNNKNPTSIEL